MVNRFKQLLDERTSLANELKNITVPSKQATFQIRLNQIVSRIKHFGQKYPIVKVIAHYKKEGQSKIMEVYFTGIEEFEALDYVRYRLDGDIMDISAHRIPVGRPIKI